MAGNCFICENSLSVGETVNVERGLQTLKNASNERDDGHLEFLNNVTSVTVHVECRKEEREENAAGPCNPSPHKKRSSKFDFRTLCLVCGEEANEDVEKRKRQEYRRKIKQVSTLSFKDNIIKTAESRGDGLGKIVRDRVNFEYDLVAAEAKYHDNCLISFNKYKSGGSVGRPHDENIRLAMEEIFYYIENNNDCQFTLTYKKKFCYENKKSNVSEERLRVVEAAAAIIREDIRSVLINTDTYPPVNQMFDNINKNIPQSNINELENKCTALSHAIMKCTRPRTFLSRLLLGISVFLHRRYGSKRLLDMLSNLGFSNKYNEVLLYESAAVNHPKPKILSPAAGAFIQYSADNADININTIDGHNTVHIMGVIQIVTPKNAVIVDEEIPRLRIIPAAKDIAAIAHVPLQMYDNFGVSGLSKIDVENILSDNVSIKSFINKIVFLWMYGKWKTVSDVPGWNGFIEYLTKENNKFSTSRILFLPFIHHPASNLNTIYTTLNSIHDNMKFHGHEACVVTFDQPLFIKAREIVAASEPGSELSKIIIRLGVFQLIMSFLGSIGYLMAGSGLKEVLSVVYAPNSVDKMLDGHVYARAVRGHILLHLALSKFVAQDMEIDDHTDDYIQRYIEQIIVQNVSYEDVEGSTIILESYVEQFNDILKKIQNRGPTAKLWVQYFYMVSKTRRLRWTLKSCKKMLPFFHASGHFLYAKSAH
ncbi:SWIM-type domain-containing protein [Aphis craccivora]|uniref:SWIM-type domain-containing protein n=1 Tax=Aphis craccivora TaxID=307492 RepID=A0A6G0W0U3_APHCR|nr:SWIM-type domain-containing protein [Aphis craccivora]